MVGLRLGDHNPIHMYVSNGWMRGTTWAVQHCLSMPRRRSLSVVCLCCRHWLGAWLFGFRSGGRVVAHGMSAVHAVLAGPLSRSCNYR